MVIDWSQTGGNSSQGSGRGKVRAAAYVRMSTEHQRYSTDNQLAVVRRYADRWGYDVVQTYTDAGKSGLRLLGRNALQSLLDDVESGRADYAAILVYDVSRWGRFQDPDEAAEIELRCKRAGILVHYCAEQFENDGSIGSSIVKTVTRAFMTLVTNPSKALAVRIQR
jgi:DNA invertase Pin-like site-specific DNA recombinase